MRHHKAMAFYDCLKFINEAVFHVLVIAMSVLLAARGIITIGTVLTAYLCFMQLTGPLRELHRILDEFSECVVLAEDYFRMVEITPDFSYAEDTEKNVLALPEGNGVVLEDVCFAYAEKKDREILKRLSLTVRPGEFLGLRVPVAAASPV